MKTWTDAISERHHLMRHISMGLVITGVLGIFFAGICVTAAAGSEAVLLVFRQEGQPAGVYRSISRHATREQTIRSVMALWLAGPTAAEQTDGLMPWLPPTVADAVHIEGETLTLDLTLPDDFLQKMTWTLNDGILRAIHAMMPPEYGIRSVAVLARPRSGGEPLNHRKSISANHRTRGWFPLDHWIDPGPPVPSKPFEAAGNGELVQHHGSGEPEWPGQPGTPGQGQYPGSLTGKSVFLSQSHGWYYNDSLTSWVTQRGNTNDIVEDFINAEAINQYLVHYLHNAGAGVYTCRERDMNTDEHIIDNDAAGYDDSGDWTVVSGSSGIYGTDARRHPVTASGHGWAEWTCTPVSADWYEVYVWYKGDSTASTDARFTISHNGGDTLIIQNQQRDGWTFKSLGRYFFDPSDPAGYRCVTLSTEGSDPSKFVIADAVRFGGGMGSIPDPVVSGRPRWEESGRYFAEFMGCDTCGTSTVSSMPKYAKWENESWEDSLYFSWHTNAPNPGTGTSTYIHDTAPVVNSDILQDWVHTEVINDIRAGYDPSWTDRGQRSANFGEVNSAYNDEMPALLIELAFHDTPGDALYLKDPKFRMLSARAIYQGFEKFFAWKDGRSPLLLPEPPEDFRVVNIGNGLVRLSWSAPPYNIGDDLLGDPATGYRVYVSETGNGFADALFTANTTMDLGPFSPGDIRYFRVSATNAGGESFATPTLAVKIPETGTGVNLLIVDAFDRIDRYALIPQYESGPLGTDLRMFLDRMQTFNYAVTHARAAAVFPGGFDSSVNEAVGDGLISLAGYVAVDWIAGEESTVDETVSDTEQAVLIDFMDAGGGVFISGAELAWDLDYYGSASDQDFCNNYLKIDYWVDDAGAAIIEPVSGGIFDGLPGIQFDYDLYEIYAAEYPDGVSVSSGSQAAMVYDGSSYAAAVTFDGDYRCVTLTMPFETILSAADRADVMDRVLNFLIPETPCLNTGDVNGSGDMTAADAQMAFYIVLGLIQPTYIEACAADCNGSGDVTAADAQAIFYVVLGLQPACADPL